MTRVFSIARFYTALVLSELVNEVPLALVADKYKCSRGVLQALQQSAATFAGKRPNYVSKSVLSPYHHKSI